MTKRKGFEVVLPGEESPQEPQHISAGDSGRDLLNQMIGHAQSRMAMRDFANVMSLAVLKQVKENKLYRAAEGQKAIDKDGKQIHNVGTWEGFCRAVGVSVAKADEDIANINAFGEEALTSLQLVGIGYRELRQYRKLPEDERLALIEAAKEGDKDQLVDLAETLIAKHAKEKAQLEEEIAERDTAIKHHQKHYDELKTDYDTVSATLRLLDKQGAFSPKTTAIRHESAAQEYGCRVHLDELEALYETAVVEAAPNDHEKGLRLHAVCLAVSAAFAHAEALYARLKEELGEDLMPARADGMVPLDDEERDLLKGSVVLMNNAHQVGKSKREAERLADEKRGPGRPRGSKNKAVGTE